MFKRGNERPWGAVVGDGVLVDVVSGTDKQGDVLALIFNEDGGAGGRADFECSLRRPAAEHLVKAISAWLAAPPVVNPVEVPQLAIKPAPKRKARGKK